MPTDWTPDVEAAYHAQLHTVDPVATDDAVTAVCDAVEKACGNRLAAADFPLRFVVAAVLEHLDNKPPSATERLAEAILDGRLAFDVERTYEGHVAGYEVRVSGE